MSSLLFVLLGSLCAALYNYIFRKSSGNTQLTQQFLFWSFLFSLILALAISGEKLLLVSWPIIGLGAVAGLFVILIFYALPKAFAAGSTNLSIGIFQSACILPPLLMSLIFGCDCGFYYTLFHGVGALLVILGFLRSALQAKGQKISLKWLFYIGLTFFAQAAALTIYQYQALLTKPLLPHNPFLLPVTSIEASSGWFLPTLFLVVVLGNGLLLKGHILSAKKNLQEGALGSLFNTGAVAFLMIALAVATQSFTMLIIPINAVLTITFCNIWSQWIYKEKVDWVGMLIALSGILLSFL
ncbi:MAG: hypothetical protein WCN87_02385 [Chlamydiota bacterium]